MTTATYTNQCRQCRRTYISTTPCLGYCERCSPRPLDYIGATERAAEAATRFCQCGHLRQRHIHQPESWGFARDTYTACLADCDCEQYR